MPDKAKAYVLLVFGTLFWGTNFHFAQVATQYMSPMGASVVRYFFAVLGLLFLIPFYTKKVNFKIEIKKAFHHSFILTIISVVGVFLFNYYFFLGLTKTEALNGALIIALNPILTLIFSLFLLKQFIAKKQLIGVVLSLVGVLIIISKADWNVIKTFSFNIGDTYMLLATSLFALHHVLMQKFVMHLNAIVITIFTTTIAFLLFVIFSFNEIFIFSELDLDAVFWASIIFMGIAGTTLSFSFWNIGITTIG
ncbi:MAG: DMT family transporter, partial [Cyclobacteriaceae bacterium]|nr:DMT family transporter [Cyclobacteriaceae bacterium]